MSERRPETSEERWRRLRPWLVSAGLTLLIPGIVLSEGWPLLLCGFVLLYVAAAPFRGGPGRGVR